jgi:hypothetical protein
MGWSISRYIQWLDEHPSMNDRLTMIKYVVYLFIFICLFLNHFYFRGTLETYVQTVRNRQQKEFAPIYIIILNILEKGLVSSA